MAPELAEALPLGVAGFDADRKLLWCNALFGRILAARGVAVAPGDSYASLLDALLATTGTTPEARADCLEARIAAVSAGLRDHHVIKARGEWAIALTTAPVDTGETVLTLTDLSEQEQRDAILNNAELMARSGAWQYDLVTHAVDFSEGVWAVFGAGSKERMGSIDQWIAAVHPEDRARMAAAVDESRAKLTPYAIEYRVYRTDGALIDLVARGMPVRDSQGKPRWYRGTFTDVTEIRETQRALERSEARGRAIIESSPDIIALLDETGRIAFASPAVRPMLGYDVAEMIGMGVADVVHPDDIPLATAALDRMVATAGHGEQLELRLRHKDGRWIDVEVAGRNFLIDPAVRGILTNIRDISYRKQAEARLRQAQKMEAVGQLTGGIAHDFNNLLAVVAGNVELLADQLRHIDAPGDLLSRAERALRATDRGATLTRSLLAFARQQTLLPSTLDVNHLVDEMYELVRRTLPENIALSFLPADGLWLSDVDPGQLQNALLNLIINARDAMPDGGALTIETANVTLDDDLVGDTEDMAPGAYVMLAVSDTGVGMPKEVVRRAFDPFFTTKGLGKGTGLGLSMVFGFARQSGGHARIYSEPGVGTTVRLYLPRSAAGTEDARHHGSPEGEMRGHERLLVVEDDPDLLALAAYLLRAFGYAVLEASSGEAALAMLADRADIDLLLTDVVLTGGLNGATLAERARVLRPGLRIVFMSGYTENAVLQGRGPAHNVRLIQKPFRKVELGAAVRAALDAVEARD